MILPDGTILSLMSAIGVPCPLKSGIASHFSALRAYLWVKSVAEMPVKPLHC